MTVRLTKEEFIRRSMRGEVFAYETNKFHYDKTKYNPFRMDDNEMGDTWNIINTCTEFIVLPKEERRYRYIRGREGISELSIGYINDAYAKRNHYTKDNGWHKLEDDYIEVIV